ncbi:hypothetical protein SO3561_01602 [Streptomyces olivochromogenes]|uniref:Uncharacterized protein n=1 Tax=Streptomyces olivochromogenes TaxID=1963 RepID=A0A250V7K9_STROL|nr:hypothetical protein SO3561_01602 [Streptomyces olivochromogenes]
MRLRNPVVAGWGRLCRVGLLRLLGLLGLVWLVWVTELSTTG